MAIRFYFIVFLLLSYQNGIADNFHDGFQSGISLGQTQTQQAIQALQGALSNTDLPTINDNVSASQHYHPENDLPLETAGSAAVEDSDGASAVLESARVRPRFTIEPSTDPSLTHARELRQSATAESIHDNYVNCVPDRRCETTYENRICNETYAYDEQLCRRIRQVTVTEKTYPSCRHVEYRQSYSTLNWPSNRIEGWQYWTCGFMNCWPFYVWLMPGPDSDDRCVVDFKVNEGNWSDGFYTTSGTATIPASYPTFLSMYLTTSDRDWQGSTNNDSALLTLGTGESFTTHPGASVWSIDHMSTSDQLISYSFHQSRASGSMTSSRVALAQILVPHHVGPFENDTWTDECSSLPESCHYLNEERCVVGPETRVINGHSVTRDCWERERHYQCSGHLSIAESTCQPLQSQGCEQMDSVCVETSEGDCLNHQQTYRCPLETCTDVGVVCLGETVCLDGRCGARDYQASQDFDKAISALSGIADAAKQFDGDGQFIFKGNGKRCRKQFIGFSNCCNDSGWGQDLSLASCREEEKELGQAKQDSRTIYVGEYCAHRVLGVCTERKRTSCVFQSKLARIIQDQGRRGQLGIGFGSAENPNCRALTPQELQQIDFSKIDFHEIYAELRAQIIQPRLDSVQSTAASRVGTLQARVDAGQPQCPAGGC